jgi:hypothetical protein
MIGSEESRLWSTAAACAGLFMTQAAGAHPAAFTLSDVMQAPFAWDMLTAPKGAAVAWVFSAKGCSNIWVADPSLGAKARQITPYTEDDGYDIGELAWSPHAKSIAFTRGQSFDHDVIMIPNEIHDMARYSSWMLLFNAADVYFDRHLDKRSVPAP